MVLGLVMVLVVTLAISSLLKQPQYADASTISLENTSILTSNQVAAGGPIPPNYTLAQQEQECVASQNEKSVTYIT
jgi:hypothetical protein